MPPPIFPATQWEGKTWDRATIRAFYQPWRDLQALCVEVHIGEFGCYNHAQNDVALRWFADLFSVFKEFGWGFSLWTFEDAFGIVNHGRPGAVYEDIQGYSVVRQLLDLMLTSRA